MTAMNKSVFRRMLRNIRGTQQERDKQSGEICRHILQSEVYKSAKVVAGYAALPHEADVTSVLQDAFIQGKTVVMPLCGSAPHMTLRRISLLDELRPGRYGIPEPPGNAPVFAAADVDLLLVPLEGIDQYGYRLGKGGGYYDCLLEATEVYSLGCALTWQMVDEVPRDAWDKPLSACACLHGVREFRRD